jgi:AcrR family transcriptional regulator
MTGTQRREQLIASGRELFAEKGFEATSIEEIALRAAASKPVVYEHFGGKEGLYAVVVNREMHELLLRITSALSGGHPRVRLEQVAVALLTYVEDSTDGFRILVRDSPVATSSGTFSSLLNEAANEVEHILAREFASRGFDTLLATLYAQSLVGMVALTAQCGSTSGSPPRKKWPRTWSTSVGTGSRTSIPRRGCFARHAPPPPAATHGVARSFRGRCRPVGTDDLLLMAGGESCAAPPDPTAGWPSRCSTC